MSIRPDDRCMKYFLIAGEASGDLHASNLMKGIRESDPEAVFRFMGGDLMQAVAPGGLFRHYREANIMGIFQVLFNLRAIAANFRMVKREIRHFAPDAVILVDYAGFNLRIARFAKKNQWKVFYYISPKVWVWRKGRIKSLKKYVDRLFVIFPFEQDFFAREGMEVEFHGNPLTDAVASFEAERPERTAFLQENNLDDKPIVALLAGSRRQEILNCLPVMTLVANRFPGFQFVVAGAPSVDPFYYDSFLEDSPVKIVYNKTYALLSHARAGIITSGTATLETALFDVPQVVIYKTGSFTYRLGRLFVKFRFFSLVNLIYGDELVKEFLQFDLVGKTRGELAALLEDDEYREKIRKGYADIGRMIGPPGASMRAGKKMVSLLKNNMRP